MLSAIKVLQASDYNENVVALRSDPPSLHSLFKGQPVECLPAGSSLVFEGDAARHVFEVAGGVLRVLHILPDGRRVIMGFLYAGDLVGISLKAAYPYSIEAVSAVRFRRLSRKIFAEAVERSCELRGELFLKICEEQALARDHIVMLSCRNAEERFGSFLMDQLRRERRSDPTAAVLDLAMTRQDIADYLGLTIETVSRTITKLAGRGILETVGRHAVRVKKVAALAHLAGLEDECRSINEQVAIGVGSAKRH